MNEQAMWAFVIVAVVAAALIGFMLGRANGNGARQKLSELEEDLGRKDAELGSYKRDVDAHFDQTADLFVSMAGSYKALFEHLSSGYAKLSDGSDRDLFRERVATLLIDGPGKDGDRAATDLDAAEAETSASASAGDVATSGAESSSEAESGDASQVRSDEAEALLADGHPGPVAPAEVAEAEEQEVRAVEAATDEAPVASAEPSEAPADEAGRKA